MVKVISFEELQGKDEDIIILSTVRSNVSDGSLGLLSNNRRVNVVSSRARSNKVSSHFISFCYIC